MTSNIRPLGNFSEVQEKPISNISQKTKLSLKQVDMDMDKSANNLTRFITYGTPRTASTLQFNMVCVCLFLNMKVHFPSLANTTNCYFQGKGNYSYPSLDQPQGGNMLYSPLKLPKVMKAHSFQHVKNVTNNLGAESGAGVFITARTKAEGYQLANNFKKLGNIVGLTQDLETLSEIKADGFLDLYAHFFDLPSQYLPMLQEHYTLWEKLRVCCGVQMSKHWRYELNPATSRNKLEPHPYCGSLDIDVVEEAFMNTTIFKMIDDYSSLGRILRPALMDKALDGRYCSSYNEAVRTKGLKFNQHNIVKV
eukprot:scaffold4628_cov146-Skeletonema_dohrnii-CCMP3373.AAC.19